MSITKRDFLFCLLMSIWILDISNDPLLSPPKFELKTPNIKHVNHRMCLKALNYFKSFSFLILDLYYLLVWYYLAHKVHRVMASATKIKPVSIPLPPVLSKVCLPGCMLEWHLILELALVTHRFTMKSSVLIPWASSEDPTHI